MCLCNVDDSNGNCSFLQPVHHWQSQRNKAFACEPCSPFSLGRETSLKFHFLLGLLSQTWLGSSNHLASNPEQSHLATQLTPIGPKTVSTKLRLHNLVAHDNKWGFGNVLELLCRLSRLPPLSSKVFEQEGSPNPAQAKSSPFYKPCENIHSWPVIKRSVKHFTWICFCTLILLLVDLLSVTKYLQIIWVQYI